jgi:hypothetical protein
MAHSSKLKWEIVEAVEVVKNVEGMALRPVGGEETEIRSQKSEVRDQTTAAFAEASASVTTSARRVGAARRAGVSSWPTGKLNSLIRELENQGIS